MDDVVWGRSRSTEDVVWGRPTSTEDILDPQEARKVLFGVGQENTENVLDP